MSTTPPPLSHDSSAKLKKELCVFLIVLGLFLSIGGYYLLTGADPLSPPLAGIPRHLAWGAPTLLIGLIHFLAGILLVITSMRAWVIFGMVGGALLALFYLIIMVASTGKIPFSLITFAILAIPVLVVHRGILYLRLQHPNQRSA